MSIYKILITITKNDMSRTFRGTIESTLEHLHEDAILRAQEYWHLKYSRDPLKGDDYTVLSFSFIEKKSYRERDLGRAIGMIEAALQFAVAPEVTHALYQFRIILEGGTSSLQNDEQEALLRAWLAQNELLNMLVGLSLPPAQNALVARMYTRDQLSYLHLEGRVINTDTLDQGLVTEVFKDEHVMVKWDKGGSTPVMSAHHKHIVRVEDAKTAQTSST